MEGSSVATIIQCGSILTGPVWEPDEGCTIVADDGGRIISIENGKKRGAARKAATACDTALAPDAQAVLVAPTSVAAPAVPATSAMSDASATDVVVDWTDYMVLPGLIDCHDHLGIDLGDERAQSYDHDAVITLRAVRNARHLLRSGITTLRDVGESRHLDVYWKRAISEGVVEGPRLLIAGEFIMRTGGHGWYGGLEADGEVAVRKAVREQVKWQSDLVKIMITGGVSTEGSSPTMSDYTREEIAAAVDEAHRLGRRIAAHVHGGDGATWAIEAGVDSIEHGVFLTREQLQMMAEKGTFLVVTYGVMKYAAESPGVPAYYREKAAAACQAYMDTLRAARECGVPVAIGGDTYHGDPTAEVQALLGAGYTLKQALAAATLEGARLCGISDLVGSIEVGKMCDLVAFRREDVFAGDLRQVRGVVKAGKVCGCFGG